MFLGRIRLIIYCFLLEVERLFNPYLATGGWSCWKRWLQKPLLKRQRFYHMKHFQDSHRHSWRILQIWRIQICPTEVSPTSLHPREIWFFAIKELLPALLSLLWCTTKKCNNPVCNAPTHGNHAPGFYRHSISGRRPGNATAKVEVISWLHFQIFRASADISQWQHHALDESNKEFHTVLFAVYIDGEETSSSQNPNLVTRT